MSHVWGMACSLLLQQSINKKHFEMNADYLLIRQKNTNISPQSTTQKTEDDGTRNPYTLWGWPPHEG